MLEINQGYTMMHGQRIIKIRLSLFWVTFHFALIRFVCINTNISCVPALRVFCCTYVCFCFVTCCCVFLFITCPFIAHDVGPCHHGMARPRVADGGMASYMEGSCE